MELTDQLAEVAAQAERRAAADERENERLKQVCSERYDWVQELAKEVTGWQIQAMQAEHKLAAAEARERAAREALKTYVQHKPDCALGKELADGRIRVFVDSGGPLPPIDPTTHVYVNWTRHCDCGLAAALEET